MFKEQQPKFGSTCLRTYPHTKNEQLGSTYKNFVSCLQIYSEKPFMYGMVTYPFRSSPKTGT